MTQDDAVQRGFDLRWCVILEPALHETYEIRDSRV